MTNWFALTQAENRVQLQRREHFVEQAAEHVGEPNTMHLTRCFIFKAAEVVSYATSQGCP